MTGAVSEYDFTELLMSIKNQLEDIARRLPKENLVFPEAPEIRTRELVVEKIQEWMTSINTIDETIEDILRVELVVLNKVTALKYQRTLLQNTSEITSDRQFQRYFLKNHWALYRALTEWEEMKKTTQTLMSLATVKRKKLDNNVQALRSINKFFGELNIPQMVFDSEKRKVAKAVETHANLFRVETVGETEVPDNASK